MKRIKTNRKEEILEFFEIPFVYLIITIFIATILTINNKKIDVVTPYSWLIFIGMVTQMLLDIMRRTLKWY